MAWSFPELGPPKFHVFFCSPFAGGKTRPHKREGSNPTDGNIFVVSEVFDPRGNLFSTFPSFLLETNKKYKDVAERWTIAGE